MHMLKIQFKPKSFDFRCCSQEIQRPCYVGKLEFIYLLSRLSVVGIILSSIWWVL